MRFNRTIPALILLALTATDAISSVHTGIVSIASGSSGMQTCALMADRRISCWGNNQRDPSPVDVDGKDVVSVSIGWNFDCGIVKDGTVYCWGYNIRGATEGNNEVGQLGDGRGVNRTSAKPVANGSATGGFGPAISVAAGGFHACAAKSDSSVWCWGSNGWGQLGNFNIGFGNKAFIPVQVFVHDDGGMPPNPPLVNLKQVNTSYQSTCALFADDTGACWGYGYDGELGNGSVHGYSYDSPQTIVVPGDHGDLIPLTFGGGRLSAGQFHTCGLISDSPNDSIACWGRNGHGQLGNSDDTGTPLGIAVAANDEAGKITNAVDVVTGYAFSCALLIDGTVRCWGSNDESELGRVARGAAKSSRGLTIVNADLTPLGQATQIVAGAFHVCVLRSDRQVYCWGNNGYAELGPAVSTVTNDVPTLVPIDAPIFFDNFQND